MFSTLLGIIAIPVGLCLLWFTWLFLLEYPVCWIPTVMVAAAIVVGCIRSRQNDGRRARRERHALQVAALQKAAEDARTAQYTAWKPVAERMTAAIAEALPAPAPRTTFDPVIDEEFEG